MELIIACMDRRTRVRVYSVLVTHMDIHVSKKFLN
jgi:hypothetical protein